MMKNTEKTLINLAFIFSIVSLLLFALIVFAQSTLLSFFMRLDTEAFIFPFVSFFGLVLETVILFVVAVLVRKASLKVSRVACLLSVICIPVLTLFFVAWNQRWTASIAITQGSERFAQLSGINSIHSLLADPLGTASLLLLAIATGMIIVKERVAKSTAECIGSSN